MNRPTRQLDSGRNLWNDDCGLAISVELLLVGIVVGFGLLAGLAAMRDAVVSELSDVTGAVQDLNQSHEYNGIASVGSVTSGSNFIDSLDFCDDVDDISGAADNGITFDVPPSDEQAVSPEGLVVVLRFDSDGTDGSGSGNDGTLRNGATIVGGELVLDGVNDFVTIGNTPDINTSTHDERTIHVEFTPTDVTTRQLIYEEGGGIRGFNIYIEDGRLYLGAYNIPETNFRPTYLSVPITAGQTTSATIVLDAGPTIEPNGFSGFVNGSLIGQAPASQLFSHGGGIGIGGVNGNTVFHSGGSTTGFVDGAPISSAQSAGGAFFGGTISEVQIFNRALSNGEVGAL
jgi:hypothetical protein